MQKNYYNDVHYVWCSDSFDSGKVSAYSAGAHVPPSSNPIDIYKVLSKDVAASDGHSYKITEQKASIKKIAIEAAASGGITDDIRDEILYIVDNSGIDVWRPLIYLIPKDTIASRLSLVHISKRAGIGPEYTISDLKGNEFQIIDLQ